MRRLLIPLLLIPLLCFGQERPRGPWLRLGAARTGALAADGSRWFSLRSEADTPTRIETGDPALLIELYDRERTRVLRSARSDLFVLPAPHPTRLWVRLINRRARPIDYRLTWARYRATPDDHGDSAQSATALTLGAPLSGSIERVADSDWFRASLEAKRDYEFALEGPAHQLLRIELLDSTGERLYDSASVTGRRRVFLRPLRAGTYCVRVLDQDDNPAVDYTLTWDLAQDDHGDTASTAAELTENTALGALETFEDEDWFVVPLIPGRPHWVSYSGVFTVELVDSDGRRVLERGELHGALRTFTPRAVGPYYLRVPPDMPGRYAIAVHVE